ncbi:hypothetical protein PFISCL1PPCAC_4447, partial [Pristionchus fissidentatus]
MEFGEGRTTVLVSGPNGQIKLEVENEEEFDGPAPEPVEVKEEIMEDEPFTRNMEEVEVKQELNCEERGEAHPTNDTISKERNRKNRPFECEICHKTFAKEHTFKKHVNFHKGIRPFGCSVCGKRYLRRHYLTKHKRNNA